MLSYCKYSVTASIIVVFFSFPSSIYPSMQLSALTIYIPQ